MKGLLLFVLVLALAATAAGPGYSVTKKLPLGGDGGWDYLTVDSANGRLFVTRSTHVMVVDLKTGTLAGDIPDTLGVHGIALAPPLSRAFTSNGGANTSTILDLKTLKPVGQVKTGANPDAIVFDPFANRVITFNGRSHDATIFEGVTGDVIATLPLGGKPEFAQTDGHGKVYVNIEDTAEVIEIEIATPSVTKRFSIKPCEEPSGLALDAAHHRVYSGCRNKIMTILDTVAGKVISTLPIGAGVDGAGYDPGAGLAFASNGDGTLTVIGESSPGKFEVLETVPTQRGARTMALDPQTHTVYLPTAQFGPTPKPTADVPRPRPSTVKDSFVVLVVAKEPLSQQPQK